MKNDQHFSIALDGPSGAGKSTIAKALSRKLSCLYIDTGAFFRTLAVYFLDRGFDPEDESGISKAAQEACVTAAYQDGVQRMYLDGTDVTGRLRTEDVSAMASKSSRYPAVRSKVLLLERELARTENVIMDGRDIGTVVLPDATLKIFLTADAGVRADRRYAQLKEQGLLGDQTRDAILADIEERDYRDSHRSEAPLRMADDAVLLDSSTLREEEVQDLIVEALQEKLQEKPGGQPR